MKKSFLTYMVLKDIEKVFQVAYDEHFVPYLHGCF